MPLLTRQRIDPGGDQALDGLGQLGHRPVFEGATQFDREERVAARATNDQFEFGVRERSFTDLEGDRPHVGVRKWFQIQDPHVGGVVRRCPGSARPSGENRSPRTRLGRDDQVVQQLARRLVDPVEVLDHKEHGTVQDGVEEVDDDVVDACPPELRVDGVGIRGRCDVGAERHSEQWEHGEEVRSRLPDHLVEQLTGDEWIGADVHARARPQQRSKDAVGRRRAVRRAGALEDPQAFCRCPGGIEEARLADAGTARQDDHRTELADGVGEHVELGLTPDQRRAARVAPNLVRGCVHLVGDDRFALSLHQERLEFLADEHGARVADDGGDGDHVTIFRFAEHAGGSVHRVAHERVRAAVLAAEEAGEHAAGLDTLAEDEGRLQCRQLQRGVQERVAGITEVHRRSGTQDELDAVARDVGVEIGDAERRSDALDVVDESMERLGHRSRTVTADESGDAHDHQEPDADEAVLPTGSRECGQLFDDRLRDVGREILATEVAVLRTARLVAGRPGHDPASVFLADLHVLGQVRDNQWVDERVALGRFTLEPDHLVGALARDEQLAVVGSREEHVEGSGCDPDGHRQVGPFRSRR